jgi:nickel superoxide dismutase
MTVQIRDMLEGLVRPQTTAYAHCDLPCGIYDPAQARIEAESVRAIQERYNNAEQMKGATQSIEDYRARALNIKEQRADMVKHHLWVLWTDYFKPEHLKAHTNLHQLFWDATKSAGAAKKTNDVAEGQKLLDLIGEIDKIFWETKKA